MDKLLEVKIGGVTHSGWIPLSAMSMLRDLLGAIAEEGTEEDEALWKTVDPQIEVVGTGSTVVAVHTSYANKLRPQVKRFREKAKRLALRPEGRNFVKKHITPNAHWTSVTLIEVPAKQDKAPTRDKDRVLKFDARYKERLLMKQAEPIHGYDEVYAQIVRAGGELPTVQINFLNGKGGTYYIHGADRLDLARRIANRLYETVKLRVETWWNPKTLEVEKLVVHDILDWHDVHLAEVYRTHGNRLPIELTFNSVEELIEDREQDRSE